VAATIGHAAGSTGTMNVGTGAFVVTGSGSEPALIIGNHGTGTLSIVDAAQLNVPGFNSRAVLGNQATGVGTATVSGAGSIWINGNELWVGSAGTGTLIIQDGGRLRCTSGAGSDNIIGVLPGAHGAVTVTGPGSTWTYGNALVIGNGGEGTLTIANGGTVVNNVSASTQVGPSGSGTATITGPGSTWTSTGFFVVGSTGTGMVEVLDGAAVACGSALIRGLNAGSGRVLVTGSGSAWTVSSGSLIIGQPENGFSTGPTSLTVGPGATVNVVHDIVLGANGLLQLQGGTLSVDTIGPEVFPGQLDWTSGTLEVRLFLKSLTNQAGRLVPKLANGGAVVDGTYTQSAGAELEIRIGGPASGTQYGFIGMEGPTVLDGLLLLSLIDGFVPTPTETFVVLASSSNQGTFKNVADGQRLTTTDSLGSFVVHYEPADEEGRHHVVLTDFAPAAP
jgi:T5SS/PEP-CTERM-associated repeat protein